MQRRIDDPDAGGNILAAVSAPDLDLDPQECVMPEPSEPCTIVIMGATGDLTSRKLMPQLFNLYLDSTLVFEHII